jgi:LacI family transcriptional regulator
MKPPRVLLLLGTEGEWSRGILRGFMTVARELDWTILHYHPSSRLSWQSSGQAPDAAVVGHEHSPDGSEWLLAPTALISVTVDRTADGIASVCPDEERVGALAAEHLLAAGLRYVSTFRWDESAFAVAREQAFLDRARAAGVEVCPGWGGPNFTPLEREESPERIISWLCGLPKPCGIFTCTDGWARPVARYADEAGLRIPEDLALIGAGNDVLECELISPSLSSVMIPWQELGRNAATLVRAALAKRSIAGRRSLVSPIGVTTRRSSDVLAVDDSLVADAIRWIRAQATRRMSVPMVARAVGSGRQRLERRFRRALGRTVQEEIRRARVELAKQLLSGPQVSLAEIARQSGFTSASLLNAAFQRELGSSPGAYRRRLKKEAYAEPKLPVDGRRARAQN